MIRAAFIDNQFLEGEGASVGVDNPSTGAEFARFPGASLAQVSAAIESARRACDSGVWSELPMADRAVVLRGYSAALAARADRITDLIAEEAGCPRATPSMRSQVQVPLGQANQILELALLLPEVEENPLPLARYVDDWLRKPGEMFLAVLGDYGTGKTWFTRKLAHDLALRYSKDRGENRQPIRIAGARLPCAASASSWDSAPVASRHRGSSTSRIRPSRDAGLPMSSGV